MRLKGQMAELVREFKPGYRVQPTNNGHIKITDPEGQLVRLEGGQPLTLSVTPGPSGGHYWKRIRATLADAGVIEEDPTEALLRKRAARQALPKPQLPEFDPYAFFKPALPPKRPDVVLNLTWDEYEQMEEAAQLLIDKGPRTAKRMGTFLHTVERARVLMERKLGASV